MTYLQPHKRPYERIQKIALISISVVVLVILSIVISAPHIFSSMFTTLARPFWRVEFSISQGSLSSEEKLLQENQTLKREIEHMRVSIDTIQYIQQENIDLKNMLGRDVIATTSIPERMQKQSMLAAVLKRPPFSAYDELILDIGEDYGLSTTSLVYGSGNVLIGRVVSVLTDTARVKLYSSPDEKIDVLIGANNTPATAIGRGGGQYEAQVARDARVKEGDFVTRTSINDKPFGIVTTILSDSTRPFETVLFAPPINIFQIRWVIVKK